MERQSLQSAMAATGPDDRWFGLHHARDAAERLQFDGNEPGGCFGGRPGLSVGLGPMKSAALLSVLGLVACVSTTPQVRIASSAEYSIVSVFDRAEDRILLTFRPTALGALCLAESDWPNGAGEIHMGGEWISLSTASATFELKSSNFGYSPGGERVLRVEPGQELKGHIGFDQVIGWDGNPEGATFRLVPHVWHC